VDEIFNNNNNNAAAGGCGCAGRLKPEACCSCSVVVISSRRAVVLGFSFAFERMSGSLLFVRWFRDSREQVPKARAELF